MNVATAGTLFAFLAAVMLASSYALPYAAHADGATVTIPDGTGLCIEGTDCYVPLTITVAEGTTVTWKNEDAATPLHTITSGAITDDDAGSMFDSAFIATGDTFEQTFEEAGEYPYFCQLHPNMIGTVIVEAGHNESGHTGDMESGMPGSEPTPAARGDDPASASGMPNPEPVQIPNGDATTVIIPDGTGLCNVHNAECYDPMTITVAKGTTIMWENEDAATPLHTVTSGHISDDDTGSVFDSAFIATGESFEHTFEEAGEYPYFCMLHPRMTGTVIVETLTSNPVSAQPGEPEAKGDTPAPAQSENPAPKGDGPAATAERSMSDSEPAATGEADPPAGDSEGTGICSRDHPLFPYLGFLFCNS